MKVALNCEIAHIATLSDRSQTVGGRILEEEHRCDGCNQVLLPETNEDVHRPYLFCIACAKEALAQIYGGQMPNMVPGNIGLGLEI